MTDRRPTRTVVYGGPVPLWLLLFIAPLGLLFLTSLVLALALAAGGVAIAALLLPRWWRRPPLGDTRTIELDKSQFHRIETRSPRDPH
jgi:hypothetical protein